MEIVGAILASCLAGLLGFVVGGRWAPTPLLGALFGVPLGVVSAGFYVALALIVARTWPHLLDAHLVGLNLLALPVVGMASGAVGAVFGYRKSLGARLF